MHCFKICIYLITFSVIYVSAMVCVYFLFLQRKEIVCGAVEPTDEECEWQSDHEEEELSVSCLMWRI